MTAYRFGAALDYLRLLGNPRIHWRFDIVKVLLRKEAKKPDDVRLIQNAFDLSEPFVLLIGSLRKFLDLRARFCSYLARRIRRKVGEQFIFLVESFHGLRTRKELVTR